MAPPKKSKSKKKEKKSTKPTKCRSPPEPKTIESDWWTSFWEKNSTSDHVLVLIDLIIREDAGPKVPNDEEEAFKYFFRISKKTFEYICSLVRQDLISRPPSGLINIEGRLLSVEKQVAIALRRLASGESQVSVGWAFGVGQSTVSQMTWRFIESMEERAKHHLKWPHAERLEEIKASFETTHGLPNCCGAIDATHIIMTLPAVETSDDWYDQEKNYSMFLQAVVDDKMRFLDIVTGWPGNMTLSRLLKCSGFYRLCSSGERLNGQTKALSNRVEIREYVVGYTAYPLLPWLITPFEGKDLSNPMVQFNGKHKEATLLAERALGQLKGSWRILHKVMWRPDKHKLPSIILVCCLLHNIIIDCGDEVNADVPLRHHHDEGYVKQSCQQLEQQGQMVRENLCKHLNNLL